MQGRRLIGAVRMAHVDLDAELSTLAAAQPARRAELLGRVIDDTAATSHAEETVLFPALRRAMGGEPSLADTCLVEHRDALDRLRALARRPAGPGFDASLAALVEDMRNHQRDEVDIMLPVLTEALGEDGSTQLAEAFTQTLARARAS